MSLRLYPKILREEYEKNLKLIGIKIPVRKYVLQKTILSLILSIISSTVLYFLDVNILISFLIVFIVLQFFFYFKVSLQATARITKMEDIFPDVLQLMSSNMRAGMTIDKALILSARKEFFPLDEEIMKTGKEIATGKPIARALLDMAKRTHSDKIKKTITLIVSGLKAGGNLAGILEQTHNNMREQQFTEKRVASSVLMYVIFIFFAVGIGAPLLFGLSSLLVEMLIEILGRVDLSNMPSNVPFMMTTISISAGFIKYFALIFMVISNFLACLIIGIVNTGKEKNGLRYYPPILALSIGIFFLVRYLLKGFLAQAFDLI